jgi:hypothetical protein
MPNRHSSYFWTYLFIYFALSLKVGEHRTQVRVAESILRNATFTNGLQNWNLNGCKGFVCNSLENPKVLPLEGKSFAVVNQRAATWAGIEQTITDRVDLETMYDVAAAIRISGPCSTSTVRASLYIKEADNSERYSTMGRFVIQQISGFVYRNVSSTWAFLQLGMCWCFVSLSFNVGSRVEYMYEKIRDPGVK